MFIFRIMKKYKTNYIEIYNYLKSFKAVSKVTYVEIHKQTNNFFIEVPYSYEFIKRLGWRQQRAICEAELLKMNISPNYLYIDVDSFYLTEDEKILVLLEKQLGELKSIFQKKTLGEEGNHWEKLLEKIDSKAIRSRPFLEKLLELVIDMNTMELDQNYRTFRNHLYNQAISKLNDIYLFHRYDVTGKIDEEVFQQLLDEMKNGMAVSDEKK